jgi:hypothetical protein
MVIQQYGYTTIWLYNNKVIQQYGYTKIRLYNNMFIQQYGYKTIWLYNNSPENVRQICNFKRNLAIKMRLILSILKTH